MAEQRTEADLVALKEGHDKAVKSSEELDCMKRVHCNWRKTREGRETG